MKLIIVVDSSCGLTKKEAEARGWYFLPLFMCIDEKEYIDGIDITSKVFFNICKTDSVVSTSCSSPLQVTELLDKIAKPNTHVVIYPISKHLSSQYKNILSVIDRYKNVNVINSKNISTPIVQELIELEIGVRNKEITIQEGIDIIENEIPRDKNNLLLFPKYIDNLIRGGRLSASAAKIVKLLKIIPIISMKNGKLEKFDKGRVFNKTVIKTAIESYNKLNIHSKNLTVIYGYSNTIDKSIFDKIKTSINSKNPFIELYIPSVIATHTGMEAIALYFLDLKYDIKEYQFEKIKGEF